MPAGVRRRSGRGAKPASPRLTPAGRLRGFAMTADGITHVLLDFFGTLANYSPSRTEQGYHRTHALARSLGVTAQLRGHCCSPGRRPPSNWIAAAPPTAASTLWTTRPAPACGCWAIRLARPGRRAGAVLPGGVEHRRAATRPGCPGQWRRCGPGTGSRSSPTPTTPRSSRAPDRDGHRRLFRCRRSPRSKSAGASRTRALRGRAGPAGIRAEAAIFSKQPEPSRCKTIAEDRGFRPGCRAGPAPPRSCAGLACASQHRSR